MKALYCTLILLATLAPRVSRAADDSGAYGIHLYFDEKEFVDVLTVTHGAGIPYFGHMSVPNDFEGDIDVVRIDGDSISFTLPVPKNASRPAMLFHYEGKFFDAAHKQLTGFVTIEGRTDFVASFVGFKR
jgi:hypothetical protein